MATIFTKIIQGEIPSYKIAETENSYAFLDISPIAKGHTLVVPKKEVDYIFDLEDELLSELNILAKKIAHAIKKAYPCPKVGLAIVGLEVPHAHIHLVPLYSVGDLNFNRPKLTLTADEFKEISERIKSYL